MPQFLEGELNADGYQFAVVVSRFNGDITERLLDGVLEAIAACGGDVEPVPVARVPGALELAVAARRFADSGRYDAVVCLGCVIRGETAHYDCVVNGATQGITDAATATGVPIIFGVLTTENRQQAEARSNASKKLHSGHYAGRAAVEMADLMMKMQEKE